MKITRILGTDDLFAYLNKYNLKLDEGYNGLIEKYILLLKDKCKIF